MIIREATFDDIPVIHNLAHKIWWPTYKNIISDKQIEFMLENIYSEAALKEQMNDNVKFLLSERENIPVGFAAYSQAQEGVFRIHKLYILPSEQGKGTGKMLLTYIEELARRHGGNILELNINRSNPALSFYKKQGFEIWKPVDIPYYDYILNDFVMRKTI